MKFRVKSLMVKVSEEKPEGPMDTWSGRNLCTITGTITTENEPASGPLCTIEGDTVVCPPLPEGPPRLALLREQLRQALQ